MDIISLIKEEIEANNPSLDEEKIKYIDSILKKYKQFQLLSLSDISVSELFALSLLINDQKISLKEVKDASSKVQIAFTELYKNDLKSFFDFLCSVSDRDESNNIDLFGNESLKINFSKIKIKLPKYHDFKELITKYDERVADFFDDWITLLDAKSCQEAARDAIDYRIANDQSLTRKRDRITNSAKAMIREITNFDDVINKITSCLSDLKKNVNRKKTNISICDDLIKLFESKKILDSVDSKWRTLSNKLHIALLAIALKGQNVKYYDLKEEEEHYEKEFAIQKILFDYGMNPSLITALNDFIIDSEKLKEFLDTLKENGFPITSVNDKDFFMALLNSDNDSLTRILGYYKTGAFSLSFLKEHYSQIISDKDECIFRNFNIFRNESAPFSSEQYDCNFLLMDSEELERRINLAKSYGLELIKDENVFNLIKNIELFDLVDFALEHQLPVSEVLKVTDDFEGFRKRVIISENFGLDVLTDEEEIVYGIKNGGSFFLNCTDIDELILDTTPLREVKSMKECLDSVPRIELDSVSELIRTLDESFLDSNDLRYNFNGVLISRNKVLRNSNALKEMFSNAREDEILYQSIIYKTILSDDEIDTINQCLFKNKEKKLV